MTRCHVPPGGIVSIHHGDPAQGLVIPPGTTLTFPPGGFGQELFITAACGDCDDCRRRPHGK